VRVNGYVSIDLFKVFGSPKEVPDNVEYFLALYSAPTDATKEARKKEGSPHMPGSGSSD
jgi:hypothetical protein